jgi:hypothetical protein
MCAMHAKTFLFYYFFCFLNKSFALLLRTDLICNTALVFWTRAGTIPRIGQCQRRREAFVIATGGSVCYIFGISFVFSISVADVRIIQSQPLNLFPLERIIITWDVRSTRKLDKITAYVNSALLFGETQVRLTVARRHICWWQSRKDSFNSW